jgi:hypothetical protein
MSPSGKESCHKTLQEQCEMCKTNTLANKDCAKNYWTLATKDCAKKCILANRDCAQDCTQVNGFSLSTNLQVSGQ